METGAKQADRIRPTNIKRIDQENQEDCKRSAGTLAQRKIGVRREYSD